MNPAASEIVIGSGMGIYSMGNTYSPRWSAMSKVKVAILGGSGYTAVELMKILLRHPGAEIAAVTSRQDEHVADLHPSLLGRLDLRCEPFDPDRLKAKGVQVAFGCRCSSAAFA
jgi:N-acetyl-gamma-glutamyl-phosphate reductase